MTIKDHRDLPFAVEPEVVDHHLAQMGTAVSEYIALLRYVSKNQTPDTPELQRLTGHSRNTVDVNIKRLEALGLVRALRKPGTATQYEVINAPKQTVVLTPELLEVSRVKPRVDTPEKPLKPPKAQSPQDVARGMIKSKLGRFTFQDVMQQAAPVDRQNWFDLPHETLSELIAEAEQGDGRGTNPKTLLIRALDAAVRGARPAQAHVDPLLDQYT